MDKLLKIAIDGPAASGKGTIARQIASELNIRHLDTGLLYRAVAVRGIANGISLADEDACESVAQSLAQSDMEGETLRSAEAGRAASIIAAHQGVRTALLSWQRGFAEKAPGAVLDGRDIGTVVLPAADAKLYVTADLDVRAARRWRELSKASDIAYRTVLEDLRERDERDGERADAPMKQAEDAILLDTTEMSVEQAKAAAVELVKFRLAEG